jgi:phosphoglycerate dehydrogenase-like enzyme
VTAPGIAVGPIMLPQLQEAIEAGGARVVEPPEADGVVWIDPTNPQGLAELLEKSPARWVQLPFAGIESFLEAGVVRDDLTWTCTKGVYGEATAEHALALILAAARRLHEHARATSWREGWAQLGQPERRLKGMTVLIVGTGGIGSALARFLQSLGPRILAVNRSGRALAAAERTEPIAALHSLLPEADFVAIAAALTPETRGMFGAEEFTAMKSDAWLVNVARGGLVDTNALVAALKDGRIGGAALDVTDPEPLPEGHPLWGFENTIITPHVANTADMAIPELQAMVRRNVEHFVKGENLEGLVDVSLGY